MYYYHEPPAAKPPVTRTLESAQPRQLAQSYVPPQAFHKLYAPMDSLKYGTVFEELNMGYGGRGK